ncbi:flagellar assembly protein FliH [Helicobacter sp. MIT 14-3879]|uniref:flagellar assembly protein FliH n=1 Tax=Helicobacter sp. MIT 14-3879 TaxID=2040649 RepID=UPI0015F18EFF|nr:flagellar assembly protein FliH [Helicobacter sp. MIT 14-3879]
MNNDKSVISSQELSRHSMKKYEFKTISQNELRQQDELKKSNDFEVKEPSRSQVAMIESSLEKELIEKLLIKSDDLAASLSNFQTQFQTLQTQSIEREKAAKEEGIKEGQMMVNLELKNSIETEREKIAKSIEKLDNEIKNAKEQIIKLESELSTIALDIAREVIIKEISQYSAKIAASIAKELLQSMSANLNVVIKVNPSDFEFLDNLIKNKSNISIKSDDAIAKGGVVIVSENGNIDGNVMSRYQLLKQSVLENFRQ